MPSLLRLLLIACCLLIFVSAPTLHAAQEESPEGKAAEAGSRYQVTEEADGRQEEEQDAQPDRRGGLDDPAGDGSETLGRMGDVGFVVEGVVDGVGSAGGQAERPEGDDRVPGMVSVEEAKTRRRSGEDHHVFDPLGGP